jgi:hypothetical protein
MGERTCPYSTTDNFIAILLLSRFFLFIRSAGAFFACFYFSLNNYTSFAMEDEMAFFLS